jgi:predicted DCC family thiol-disulfide oxidoreductase YuxK
MATETQTPRHSSELPRPEDRPGSDVVIYDGDCKICTGQVKKLVWWDCQKHLSYLSLHDPVVAERYPDLTHEELMKAMVIVDRRGRRHRGAEAFAYLTLRLRRLWWLAPLLKFPGTMQVWQFFYRKIAERRYQIGGKTDCESDACQLHAPPKK